MTSLAKWRALARAWSTQLAALGAVLFGFLATIDPQSLQAAWQSLPPELRAMLPAKLEAAIGAALFALVIIARAAPQPRVATLLSSAAAAPWLAAARKPIARTIASIAVHCSATPEGRVVTAAEVRRWHKTRGFDDIGYHFLVRLDGTIEVGRPLARAGAHVRGFNAHSIGICYAGGLATDGKTPKDTRTPEQKAAMRQLLGELKRAHPAAEIKGHRDYSPDRNGDGRITSNEWLKACPSFDARAEYAGLSA